MRRTSWKAVWVSPLVVASFLCALYAMDGIFPFGIKTLAWGDMNHQVIPLLMDFQDILHGNDSMFWNQQNAGGMSFWGVFFFFLASPLHFLMAFVPKADFYYAVNFLVLAKMALASCTAALLFCRCFPRLAQVQVVCLSGMYAFCGYALLYEQNLVWLDMLAWFPILLLGLRALYYDGKPLLFIGALAAVVVLNYYLSAMVFFWLVLCAAAFVGIVSSRRRRGRQLALLGISVALALLLTAVVWLPSFLQYLHSGRKGGFVENISGNGTFTDLSTTLPIWICTALTVAVIPLFFLARRKSRTVIALFVVYVLLLIPLWFNPVDCMWHLGSYQAFPVRFGYILTMMGLLLAAQHLDKSGRQALAAKSRPGYLAAAALVAAAAVVIAAVQMHGHRQELSRYVGHYWSTNLALQLSLWVVVAMALGYFLVLLFYRKRKLSRRAVCVLLCVLACTEAGFQARSFLTAVTAKGDHFAQATDLQGRIQDDSFYRVKTDNLYLDPNLLGGLGYPTTGHYTSLTDNTYMNTMQSLGYSTTWMDIRSIGGTLLSDAVLAQRYSITTPSKNDGRKVLYANGTYQIVEQPVTMPFGFVAVSPGGPLPQDRFDAQEAVYRAVTGRTDSLFARYTPTAEVGTQIEKRADGSSSVAGGAGCSLIYTIPVQQKETLYFDCHSKISNGVKDTAFRNVCCVLVNGQEVMPQYPTSAQNGILTLGTFENTTVTVRVEMLSNVTCTSFGVAGLPHEKLQQALRQVPGANLQVRHNTLSGKVTTQKAGWLVIPTGTTEGVTAQLNGSTVQCQKAFGDFLAVPVQAGTNTISVRFVPPGFVAGGVVSLIGVAGFLLFACALRRGQTWLLRVGSVAKVLFALVAAAVFFGLYGLPWIVCIVAG